MSAAWWVLRRELHVMLRAPILYVIGGLFLAVQGISFAGLVGALSDPRRPAPLGALLEGQLAGTLLTWVLELVVLTLLGMRAIAEDKRSGAWELLLTAQVGEGAAVVGKWLAAVAMYALLWVPTLAYLVVVAVFRADAGGGWDLGAIAVGYLGAIAIGAALLAWAIAASAAMASTLGAGALGFAFAIGLFLVGELPSLWPTLAVDHPSLAIALEAVSLRGHAVRLARGEVGVASLALVGGLAVVGLSLAMALACVGRRRASELRLRFGGTIALAVIAACTLVLAVRHPLRIDASATGRNSLDPDTRGVLAALPGPATLWIVRPTFGELEPVYDEVARVADRMAEVAPALTVRAADPATMPGGFAAIARAAGIAETELAPGGSVVVELARGGVVRRRVVELDALATLERGAGGAPVVTQLAVEQAIAGALAALSADRPLFVCATTGHGELPLDREDPSGVDWTTIAARLRADGMTIDAVAIAGVPPACNVLVVAGPSAPLSGEEALAIQTYLRAGGALLVAAPSRSLVGGLGATGLEGLLAGEELGLPAAIAIDPSITPRDLPGGLVVVDGYADHPINRGFAKTRSTLWFQPRAVVATGKAQPLVSATTASWGEVDLSAPPAKSSDDLGGPIALAAISGKGKTIAIGSAESFSRAVLALPASAGSDLWLARALRHLAGAPEPRVDVAARAPDQIRLVLTDGERSAIVALCVGGIPVAWLLVGGLALWWRRRKAGS